MRRLGHVERRNAPHYRDNTNAMQAGETALLDHEKKKKLENVEDDMRKMGITRIIWRRRMQALMLERPQCQGY